MSNPMKKRANIILILVSIIHKEVIVSFKENTKYENIEKYVTQLEKKKPNF